MINLLRKNKIKEAVIRKYLYLPERIKFKNTMFLYFLLL